MIPDTKHEEYEDRKDKRLERFNSYKEMLMEEIVDLKKAEISREIARENAALSSDEEGENVNEIDDDEIIENEM